MIIVREFRGARRWTFFLGGLFVAGATSLAGCASAPEVPVDSPAELSRYVVAPYFELKGRISVRVSDKIDSGQLTWTRDAAEERIGLYSPLGSQLAEVVQRKGEAARMQRDGEVAEAVSIDELAGRLLGVSLATQRVASWVQGVGLAEGQMVEQTLVNGERWMVTAERFQNAAPHRFVGRLSAVRGEITVRLVIDEWHPL